ncbi:hypothetical protein VC83_06893 [Pseudogymnoascus destructans]|uniref:Uncharacterized protein n=1 Tax=Pseudogymnoascus destructans TaxID=655981 RepID=A0A177A7A1_9PEZI|nr:uncharacterized protein VC83_06893 [Pseudogymnoascus destructans]OAF56904.1 hypothetical protein VC83_06893 [Pseudogymnoascus destructans]
MSSAQRLHSLSAKPGLRVQRVLLMRPLCIPTMTEQTGQERSPSPAPSENVVSQRSSSSDSGSEDAADQGAPDPGPVLRRSGRKRHPAQRFEGAYAAAIEEIPMPRSFKEAMKSCEYAAEWAQAVREELTMLQSLGAWEIVKLP